MKKILASLYTSAVFLAVIINSQFVYADVIMPGQSPGGHGAYRRPHEPIKDDQIIPYIVTACIVVAIVVISVIVLSKIRKKK